MALRGITVDFGETGMVFILGKSGCGKSTLLHVMGGLDFPTSGEIVIDGKSSKDFTKEDYDNYRNTYVGFVFQEYNLLPEFTVYENLAIALQLQGKKADKALLKEYLKRVDLDVDEKAPPPRSFRAGRSSASPSRGRSSRTRRSSSRTSPRARSTPRRATIF